jgi:GT2 family glycosyltransferase
VVTRNRVELLRRCLAALDRQERAVDHVLVVDNASDDGTAAMVRDEFPDATLLALEENVGGAGGFCRGLAWAHERGYDWLWLMDDDTLAFEDTLAALLAGARRAPGGTPLLVASQVLGKDDRLHPMNLGLPRWRSRVGMAEAAACGLLLMRYATFVSVAIRREAIDRFGLPLQQYFLWGDDVEFTARVLRRERGYLVPDSRVYHWTDTPRAPENVTGDRFYYHVRNSLLLLRGRSLAPIERLSYLRWYVGTLRGYLRAEGQDRREALGVVLRGLRDGLRMGVG